MRNLLTLFFFGMSVMFAFDVNANIPGGRLEQPPETAQAATYGYIDAKGLKALVDSGAPVKILDARETWGHDYLIQGAYQASASSSTEYLYDLVRNYDELIVVYCYSYTCPLSARLINKLLTLGYTNIIEYPGGLKEWHNILNYPVDNIN